MFAHSSQRMVMQGYLRAGGPKQSLHYRLTMPDTRYVASMSYAQGCLLIAGSEEDNRNFPGGVVHIIYEGILRVSCWHYS